MVRKNRQAGPGSTRYLGLVLLADVAIVACGRSDILYKDDAFGAYGNGAGVGGKVGAGGGQHTGGKGGGVGTGGSVGAGATGGFSSGATGGVGTGGVGTGGTGGAFTTGGSFSTGGGPIMGGSGGRAGSGGSAGGLPSAGAGPGPFACQGTFPTCDAWSNFRTDGISWGYGDFTGGLAVFGPKMVLAQDSSRVHVTGTVVDYGSGIILWFTNCSNLSPYQGVSFSLSGDTGFNDSIWFMPLTNADYPWQDEPQNHRGGCTSTNATNPWVDCIEPRISVPVWAGSTLYWGDFSGGAPVTWSTRSPAEIVGLEWLFPYDTNFGPYTVDVTLDDVALYNNGLPPSDCGSFASGGMGGMAGSGSGGKAGSAGSAGAGMSGGGVGGTSSAGSGPLGGEGGVVDGAGGVPLGGFAGF